MHILLPPSEGKAAPTRGRTLDLVGLSNPELTATRERVIDALITLARGPAQRARTVLGISEYQAEELARDADLMNEPTAQARSVYTGVLYEALALHTLPGAASRQASRSLLISSAAFGVLRPTDRIPAYRLSGDTTLPGLGPLSRVWREPLTRALTATLSRGLVLDLRSTAYAGLMPIREPLAARTVTMRVVQERRVGREVKRTVVSHFNKATKGQLVHALLESGERPTTADTLVSVLRDLGFRCEIHPRDRYGVCPVDIIVDAP